MHLLQHTFEHAYKLRAYSFGQKMLLSLTKSLYIPAAYKTVDRSVCTLFWNNEMAYLLWQDDEHFSHLPNSCCVSFPSHPP